MPDGKCANQVYLAIVERMVKDFSIKGGSTTKLFAAWWPDLPNLPAPTYRDPAWEVRVMPVVWAAGVCFPCCRRATAWHEFTPR